MAIITGCNIPENLFYLADKHVWLRLDAEGLVTLGMDDVACHLAGTVVAVTPKKAGRVVSKGQSVATIESSKWVGPVPAPISGEIVETNEAVRKDPLLLNQDPYGQGWIVRMRPGAWEAERSDLVTGPDGVEAYRALLASKGIACG